MGSCGETETTIGFPTIENGDRGPMVVIRSIEGGGCGRDWNWELSLS